MPGDGQTTDLQKLLQRAIAEDGRANDELISSASARLLKLTRKMFHAYPHLRRWEQTDDVYQQAALRLYRSLREVRPESPQAFFGLAATQIRRTLIDLARHHFGPQGAARHHHSDAANGLLRPAAVDNAAAPAGEPQTLEEWTRFHELAESLPDNEREVFSLVWYSGMRQEDVAGWLGVSVPTVKRRWQRARIALFERMRGASPEAEDVG